MRFLATDACIHVEGPITGEFTLCGQTMEGLDRSCTPDDEEVGIDPMHVVPPQQVTCERCLAVLALCREVERILSAEA